MAAPLLIGAGVAGLGALGSLFGGDDFEKQLRGFQREFSSANLVKEINQLAAMLRGSPQGQTFLRTATGAGTQAAEGIRSQFGGGDVTTGLGRLAAGASAGLPVTALKEAEGQIFGQAQQQATQLFLQRMQAVAQLLAARGMEPSRIQAFIGSLLASAGPAIAGMFKAGTGIPSAPGTGRIL